MITDDYNCARWAVVFDGGTGRHVVGKTEIPIDQCTFSSDQFYVRIGDTELGPGTLLGRVESASNNVTWNLAYADGSPPVFDFPLARYESSFPKAKALVGVPMARFDGTMMLNGETLQIDDWVGSQNHNWGVRHTDRYAWGQVCGFDNARDSFLEVASAQLKLGPLWSPLITLLIARHAGKEYAFNSFLQGVRARASYDYFAWRFASSSKTARIEGQLRAPREASVALRYCNPPHGIKYCLNSKIAECTLPISQLRELIPCERRPERPSRSLLTTPITAPTCAPESPFDTGLTILAALHESAVGAERHCGGRPALRQEFLETTDLELRL